MIKLVAFDMEGCLTDDPTVWEIMHRKWGTWESRGSPYWDRYRAGEFSYDEFARMDVATWRNAPLKMLDDSTREVPLMPGCRELLASLNEHDIRTVIITNGLAELAERLRRKFQIARVYGNVVERDGSRLTGRIKLQVPFHSKGELLKELATEMGLREDQIAAAGDGRADVEMFRFAGTSVAFCPGHRSVAENATHVVRDRDLRSLSPLLIDGRN